MVYLYYYYYYCYYYYDYYYYYYTVYSLPTFNAVGAACSIASEVLDIDLQVPMHGYRPTSTDASTDAWHRY